MEREEFGIETCAFSLLTFLSAPFMTISASLQLSVQKYKSLLGGKKELNEQGLMKVPTELTLRDKRRYELLIKVF